MKERLSEGYTKDSPPTVLFFILTVNSFFISKSTFPRIRGSTVSLCVFCDATIFSFQSILISVLSSVSTRMLYVKRNHVISKFNQHAAPPALKPALRRNEEGFPHPLSNVSRGALPAINCKLISAPTHNAPHERTAVPAGFNPGE